MSEARFEKLLEQLNLALIRTVYNRIARKENRYLQSIQVEQMIGNNCSGKRPLSSVFPHCTLFPLFYCYLLTASSLSVVDDISVQSETSQNTRSSLNSTSTANTAKKQALRVLDKDKDKDTSGMVGLLTTNAGYPIDFADFPELIMEPPYTVSLT
jgi:PDZ domain-containing secreted protein